MMKRYIKMPLKYALPLLFICALVLSATTGCTDSTNPTATPSAQATVSPSAAKTTATPTPTPTPKATATPAPTSGQGTASDNHYSLTATNQGIYTDPSGRYQPAAGNKFVSVFVEVTNKDKQNALMGNMFQFTLFDNKNIGHEAATATVANPNYIQSLANSNPGEKTAGILVFEMPTGNTPTKIVYNEGLLQGSLTVNF